MKRKIMQMKAMAMAAVLCISSQPHAAFAMGNGTWKEVSGDWFYESAEGENVKGWQKTETGWYYLDQETGKMSKGWRQIEGTWYYFSESGSLKSGWLQNESGEWFFLNTAHDGTYGAMKTGWQWIDGHCYYFLSENEAKEGYGPAGQMLKNTRTPDGYMVNSDGKWIDDSGVIQYSGEKGLKSTETAQLLAESAIKANASKSSEQSGASRPAQGSSQNKNDSVNNKNDSANGENNSTNNKNDAVNNTNKPSNGENKPSDKENGKEDNNEDNKENNKEDNNKEDNNENGTENRETILIEQSNTGLADLGWAQYAMISLKEGTAEEYEFYVNGVEITDAVTPVTDNGTIVKWETSTWNPGTLTVVRSADGAEQDYVLSESIDETPNMSGDHAHRPSGIVTNGAVSSFDFYLDVYDENGNVRVKPEYTTFDLDERRVDHAAEIPADYYVPDALISNENGTGTVEIKLALKNDEQKAWFEGLSQVRAMNTENKVVNENLIFETRIESSYGTTGVITVELPQTNLRSRGRYQMNLVSEYSENRMTVPVHLVDSRNFEMNLTSLNMAPKPGECFSFKIVGTDGSTFGNEILTPIYRVDMKKPSGEEVTLEKITDWYEIGDLLHVCGTNTNEEIITDESGVYTITVYADGYQTMTKKIEIKDGKTRSYVNEDDGIDALSSASSVVGGSGSSDGGSSYLVNAYLVFDYDLLVNALLLDEFDLANADADAVLERWYVQEPLYVMDETAENLYHFTDYLNEVKDTKLEFNRYMTFADFMKEAKATGNRPYSVKRVLEDGLLGRTESFGTLVGVDAPKLNGTTAAYGSDLILNAVGDKNYFGEMVSIQLDGKELANTETETMFAYDSEKNTLTIYAVSKGEEGGKEILKTGSHRLAISAKGYANHVYTIQISRVLEELELSLRANPNAEADGDLYTYYVGQTVYVNASANEEDAPSGDFLENLKKIMLTKPDGSQKQILLDGQESVYKKIGYLIHDTYIELGKDLFGQDGEYKITVEADGYEDHELKFTIETIQNDDNDELTPPEVTKTEFERGFMSDDLYRIIFAGSQDKVETFINHETMTVTVNGVEYEKVTLSYAFGDSKYIVRTDAYGVARHLELSTSAFTEEENVVVIEVDGYEKFEITILKDGSIVEEGDESENPDEGEENPDDGDENPSGETEEAPEVSETKYDKWDHQYMIYFLNGNEFEAYVDAENFTLTVNNEEYDRVSYSWEIADQTYLVRKTDGYLALSASAFTEEKNVVVIEVDGYEKFEITILKDGNIVEEGDESENPDEGEENPDHGEENPGGETEEAPEVSETKYDKWDHQYMIYFLNGNEFEAYVDAENFTLTVNNEEYDRVSYSWEIAEQTYLVRKTDGYLALSASAFTEEENVVVIEADGYEKLQIRIQKSES